MLLLVTVFLQNQVSIACLLEDFDFLGPKTSVVPFERQIAATRRDWQWSLSEDWLTSC
jgi:hypothetical protein